MELEMKTCFLILAHNNPEQLSVLVEDLVKSNTDIYIHIDKKSDISSFIHLKRKNVFFIKERVEIFWGEFSIVEATLNLLKASIKENYDYYALLSGSDILVQSPEKLINHLKMNKGHEFINIVPMPSTKLNKPLSRIEYYNFTEAGFKKLLKSSVASRLLTKIANKLLRNRIKRNYKKRTAIEKFYAGSQWWTLSSSAVTLILNYCIKHPNFVGYFKNIRIPDEIFFQTILGNSHLSKKIMPSLTFTIWEGGKSAHPKELEERDISNLKERKYNFEGSYGASKAFIARKFTNKKTSKHIIFEREQTY
jgi:hypothetical protein